MSATQDLIAAALRLAALAERNTDDRDEWQHAIDSVREACARAMVQPAAPDGWQPIETAPKDDSYLLVSNGHGVWVARFKSVYQSGWKPPSPWQSMMLNHDHIPSAKRNGSPTHWMPLPTPPSAALHGTMEGDMEQRQEWAAAQKGGE